MPTTRRPHEHLVVAHWGLIGSATSTKPGYRPQNPWQALEHYMEGTRGNSRTFFAQHGATPSQIDRGGSVWRIVLESVPTAAGFSLDEFAHALVDALVSNFNPEPGDHIYVSYASSAEFGQLEWVP